MRSVVGDEPAPQVFEGRYEMHSRIGEGSFGVVFRARDRQLGREVALKLLKPREDDAYAQVLARFRREVEVLVRFPHPALVPVLDAHLEPPRPYLVSSWMGGGDLRRWIREGPRPAAEVARIGARLAEALGHLHGHGVLHRDVKPGNVLLDHAGEAYLADLGLGAVQGDASLTGTGEVVGTLHYMAPELFLTATSLPASDFFALGAVLLEVLQGATLDGAASDPAALKLKLDAAGPAPLRAILRRCLRTDPEGRPTSGQELAEALRGCLPDESGAVASGHASRAVPRLGASRALRAPSLRSAGPWLVALALAAGGMLAPRGPGAPASGPPASGPPAPLATGPREAEEFPSPLGEGFEEALLTELDRAIEGRFTESDHPAPAGPRSWLQRLSSQGYGILGELPQFSRVLTWLATHGGVAELPPRTQVVLHRYDQAFVELGFPPPLRPFLEAAPWTGPLPSPPKLTPPATTILGILSQGPEGPEDPWLRAAWVHFGAAMEYKQRLEQRLRSGGVDWTGVPSQGGLVLQALQSESRLGAGSLAVPLRIDEAGRETLRQLLAPGRERARDFLLAAARAIRRPGEPLPFEVHEALLHAVQQVQEFFTGSLVTASTEHLFGAEDDSEAGLLFRARLIDHLRNSQLLSVIPSRVAGEPRVRLLQAAVAACRRAGYHPHIRWVWPKLVSAMRAEERAAALLEACSRDLDGLRKRLDPAWVAGELEGHRRWARAVLDRGP